MENHTKGEPERVSVPVELLGRVADLCEYWFTRESRSGMSEREYKTWHALGFGSNAYTELRSLLTSQPQTSTAQSAPAGEREAVEVVAWLDEGPEQPDCTASRRVMMDWANSGYTIQPLMTVAQHQRIVAYHKREEK